MNTPEKKNTFKLTKPKPEMVTINVKSGDKVKTLSVPKQNRIPMKLDGKPKPKLAK